MSYSQRPRQLSGQRLHLEPLEDRLTLSWAGVPPAWIPVPTNAVPVALNAQAAAQGGAAITRNEVDYYSFAAPRNGAYTLAALTPYSNLDTVLGVFRANGQRLAYNDDISWFNTDSRLTINLVGGQRYYFGITNYTYSPGGSYTWSVQGPGGSIGPSGQGFHIDLTITGMTANQQAAFRQAAARWEQIITGDLPDATYNGQRVDDLWISASGRAIDGQGGILGMAGPDQVRSGSYLPIHGAMEFDTADLAWMESNNLLLPVITHEMSHVLGFGTIWQYKGLVTGTNGNDPRFTGRQATAAYNQIFGRSENSVPVENTGGSGTRNVHWRESVFKNELLTGWINQGVANPLSRITVASLADLGYQVNMDAADAYTPPSGGSVKVGPPSVGNSSFPRLMSVADSDLGLLGRTPGFATSQQAGFWNNAETGAEPAEVTSFPAHSVFALADANQDQESHSQALSNVGGIQATALSGPDAFWSTLGQAMQVAQENPLQDNCPPC